MLQTIIIRNVTDLGEECGPGGNLLGWCNSLSPSHENRLLVNGDHPTLVASNPLRLPRDKKIITETLNCSGEDLRKYISIS